MPSCFAFSRAFRRVLVSCVFICLAPIALSSIQAGELVGAGAAFPESQLDDQFGEERAVPGQASWIVFSNSKAADEALSPILADFVSGLQAGEIVYLSDISRMPELITTLFALPALKKRDYPVVLVRDEATAESLPARPGCYTLFDLGDDGVIQEVRMVCEEAELRRMLAQTIPAR